MTTLDDVLNAAKVGETTDWEFKSARGGFPRSFWETYSAMANSDGGVIVLGVCETDQGAQADGLTAIQASTYSKTLWDTANNRATVSVNLLTESDVQVLVVGESQLLAIRIPRATRTQRPVYLTSNPLGHTFRRRHEGDYRCDDAEVRRMLADADPTPADHRILEGFSLDDLDVPSLGQYRQRLRAAKGDHPWLGLEDRELLEKIGGWRRDRETGREGLTLAGMLMFGRDGAIRDAAAAPHYFVDYREKLDAATRWSDRIYPDGTWEANLFQFYQRVWPKLASGLAVPFQLEGGVRRDQTPAHEALREAFVNSLIHADYSSIGGVVVERHPDRFVFENPGTLLVSIEQYTRGGVSECRNKAIQKAFLLIGGGEQAGSGADKIRSGWRAQHWRAPLIVTQSQPDRVQLTLSMVSLIPNETLERLRQRFGASLGRLSPSELQALASADLEGTVSNVRLQELVNEHPFDITQMLQRLCEGGWLVSDNRRRWTTYRLGESFGDGPLFDRPKTEEVQDSTPLSPGSTPLPGDSTRLLGDSTRLPLPAVGMEATAGGETVEEVLRRIAAPVAERGKVAPELMRSTIASLCAKRYLSAEELGRLLERNPVRLRAEFLSPMVGSGALSLRHPDSPNRPDQAYTTTGSGA